MLQESRERGVEDLGLLEIRQMTGAGNADQLRPGDALRGCCHRPPDGGVMRVFVADSDAASGQ